VSNRPKKSKPEIRPSAVAPTLRRIAAGWRLVVDCIDSARE